MFAPPLTPKAQAQTEIWSGPVTETGGVGSFAVSYCNNAANYTTLTTTIYDSLSNRGTQGPMPTSCPVLSLLIGRGPRGPPMTGLG